MLQAEQRVIADVEAQHVALEGEPGALIPLLHLGQHVRIRVLLAGHLAEEVVLAVGLVAFEIEHLIHRGLEDVHQRPALVAHRIERAGLDQRFDHPLVAHDQRNRIEKLEEAGRLAVLRAGAGDAADHVVADVADGAQAEPDVGAHGGEVGGGLVDVGRQHLDAHPAALGQIDSHLVLVVAHRGEQRRHELGRVVGLEVGRPVRQHTVGRRVGLVEGVVAEGQQNVPQRRDGRGAEPALGHPGGELLELGVQLGLLLLAHRAPQQIGLAEAVAGELLGDRHHLLLVDDEPEGLPQHLLEGLGQLGVDRLHGLATVLAAGVLVVRIRPHGAGPVERADGGNVLEVIGAHAAQQGPHGAAVELKHPEGVTAGQQAVGGKIGQLQILEDDRLVAVHLDVLHRIVEHGEVTQPQEVHLDQAEGFTRGVIELGDHGAVLLALHDRDDVEQRIARHDHPRGVHAPLTLEPLQALGGVDDLSHLGIRGVQGAELPAFAVSLMGGVEQIVEGDVLAHDRRGHGLGDPLADGVGLTQYP